MKKYLQELSAKSIGKYRKSGETKGINGLSEVKKKANWVGAPYFKQFQLEKEDLLSEVHNSIQDLQYEYSKVKSDIKQIDPLYRTFMTHVAEGVLKEKNEITSVDISDNNRYVVCGYSDCTVRVFDLKKIGELRCYNDIHSKAVTKVKFTKDNQYIVTSSLDGTIKQLGLWDSQNKKEVHIFENVHPDGVNSFILSSDNKEIVASLPNDSLKILDLEQKTEILTLPEDPTSALTVFALSEDNRYILTGWDDNSVKIYDRHSKDIFRPSKELSVKEHGGIKSLAMSKDNKYIVIGFDESIKVLDFDTNSLYHYFENQDLNAITSLEISNNNKYLIAACYNRIVVFHLELKVALHHFESPGDNRTLALSRDSQLIAVGCNNCETRIFKLEEVNEIHNFKNELQPKITSVVLSSNQKYLAFGDVEGSISVFDFESKKLIHTFVKVHTGEVSLLLICHENRYLFSVSNDRFFNKLDLETMEQITLPPNSYTDTITSIALSDDNQYLVSCSLNKSIQLFDIKTNTMIYDFITGHSEDIQQVLITPDNKHIISASSDRSVSLFAMKIDVKEPTRVLTGQPSNNEGDNLITEKKPYTPVYHFKELHQGPIQAITTVKHKNYLITGSADGSIKLLDLENKMQIHSFNNSDPDNEVVSLAVSQDGRHLIAGYSTGSLKIFNLETKVEVYSLEDYYLDPVHYFAFSHNDQDIFLCNGALVTRFSFLQKVHFESSVTSPFSYITYYGESLFKNLSDASICYAFQDLYVSPHNWNIIHILSITNPADISKLPPYAEFKVPFLVDSYNKTPLHYILAHEKRDSQAINIVFRYIVDFLEDSHRTLSEKEQTMKSLSSLFLFIISKLNSKDVNKFLKLCVIPTPSRYGESLPQYGTILSKYNIKESLCVEASVLGNQMLKSGKSDSSDQIGFRSFLLYADYDHKSDEMFKMVSHLVFMKNDEIFSSPIIIHMINYLWGKLYRYLFSMGVLYSILMVLVSVSLATERKLASLEAFIALMSAGFLSCEIILFRKLKNIWKCLDIAFFMIVLFLSIAKASSNRVYNFTETWLSSMIFFIGYIRWMTYLALFNQTRLLIQVFKYTVQDILGFIIILVSITVGSALLFKEFDSNITIAEHMYDVYRLLFADFEDSEYNLSEKIILTFVLFVFNIIFVNMMITIISDSYARAQEEKGLADSLTKLDLIQETMTLLRTFLPKDSTVFKGYPIICGKYLELTGDYMNSEWQGRTMILKRLHQRSDMQRKNEVHHIREEISLVKQELALMQQDVKEEFVKSLEEEVKQLSDQIDKRNEKIERSYEEVKTNLSSVKERLSSRVQEIRNEMQDALREISTAEDEVRKEIKASQQRVQSSIEEMLDYITDLHSKAK